MSYPPIEIIIYENFIKLFGSVSQKYIKFSFNLFKLVIFKKTYECGNTIELCSNYHRNLCSLGIKLNWGVLVVFIWIQVVWEWKWVGK